MINHKISLKDNIEGRPIVQVDQLSGLINCPNKYRLINYPGLINRPGISIARVPELEVNHLSILGVEAGLVDKW